MKVKEYIEAIRKKFSTEDKAGLYVTVIFHLAVIIVLLAGGLTPDNVQTAITYLNPDGVDVSSGVEYSDQPGKDPAKIHTFVSNVRSSSINCEP